MSILGDMNFGTKISTVRKADNVRKQMNDMKLAVVKKTKTVNVKDEQCPDDNTCDDGETCCMMASGEYGCCGFEDAVCCDDGEHCCREGYECTDMGCEEPNAQKHLLSKVLTPRQLTAGKLKGRTITVNHNIF